MMSQSHGVHRPRIIKHTDAIAVSDFYAYGPLYEEIKAAEVPGDANNLYLRQITKEAWNYFVDQASRDSDLMNTIRVPVQEQIMSESSPDLELEGQAKWEGNPGNGTSGDHQNATEQIETKDEKMIKGYYMSKIAEVVEEAKSVYDGTNVIDEMPESRFKFMMINHGCLFLLQMLVFLGLGVNKLRAGSTLRDNQLDTLFGSDENDIERRKIGFSKSAVFPGNQIPLLVLNKLIDTTSFFKKIVLEENWEEPSSSDVLKSVLYDLFLGPVLKTRTQEATVVDILHALHSRLVGTTTRGDIRFEHRNVDPEALPFIDSRRNDLDPQRDNQMSVTEMYSKGMDFKGVSGMAITEINIKGNPFTNKVLHLPVFTFNEITMYLYTCLKHYENHQGPREKVVNDYLRFLSDIVQNDQDVVLLELKGVIEVDSNEVQNDHEVVEYLREVARDAPLTCTTHHLRTLKLDITHHHLKPWYYNYLINCALFSIVLSILSVIFTILQYFSERSKSGHNR
nr:uncharacterized protein LOC109175282 [Ipomoea batatas]